MSDLASRIDQKWDTGQRLGPYFLLVIGVIAAVLTAGYVEQGDHTALITVLCVAAAVLHRLCADQRWGQPLDDGLGAFYLGARIVIAFILTWINPFFALFAVAAYFDAELYVSRRWSDVALVATAVTVAGSQSGGLPPENLVQVCVFAALFVFNAGLVLTLAHITRQEGELASERTGTIEELERANARLEEALAENARLQAELVEQAREAGVHDERERLALEIHDTIAQSLTGIVTQLQAADDAPDDRSAQGHRLRAAGLARDALGEARRSVQGLMPTPLTESGSEQVASGGGSLERAMRHVVADFTADQEARAELVVTGEPTPLHQQVEATVVRIAQEALTNVARHAGATRVGVTVSWLDGEVLLDVRDDGAGFDPADTRPHSAGGFGIPGMSTRAARVAGELVVESEPGHGTAVSLRVPAVAQRGAR